MARTKAELRSAIRSMIPDAISQRWTPSALDVIIGIVQDELYGDILMHNPWYWVRTDTVAVASLAANTFAIDVVADLSQRFYKIKKVLRESQQFYPISQQDQLFDGTTELIPQTYGYSISGGMLFLSPAKSADVQVTYSYLPTSWVNQLETSTLSMPDGFEGALVFEVAARVQDDVNRMAALHAIADKAKDTLLTRVKHEDGSVPIVSTTQDVDSYDGDAN